MKCQYLGHITKHEVRTWYLEVLHGAYFDFCIEIIICISRQNWPNLTTSSF